MKVGNEAHAIETYGVEEEGEFAIAHSGKAFRALIDGLYADKPQSIVRELSANAFDSHQRAGTSKPFYIHTPTSARPEFFIRDYGVGMEHKKVMTLYNTLFKSDKTATNDEVGMFGLGSKTPFAYTDQFYVTCYDGANARYYVAAIGADGVPRILKINEEPCEEPAGVRVGFAVDENDFHMFRGAVQLIAPAHIPAFESNIELTILDKPVFQGPGWSIYNRHDYRSHLSSTWNLRQGCVLYPVEAVGGVKLPADNKYSYLLDAPIGTVTVTTSRERIEYKKATVDFIDSAVQAACEQIKEQIWEKIKDEKSVVVFFRRARELAPTWCLEKYSHPLTGLKEPKLNLTGLSCFFEAVEDAYGDSRWSYNKRRVISLESHNVRHVLILDDVTPFLDSVAADAPVRQDFSKTELRRLARFARAYAIQQKLKHVTLAIGIQWTDDYWNAVLPQVTRESVTYADLKAAIPKREKTDSAPVITAIRGIGLALAGGDTKPIYALPEDVNAAAWIDAETFRATNKKMVKLAKRFGVEELYVVSETALPKVRGNLPSLREAIEKHFADKGLDVLEWLAIDWGNDGVSCLSQLGYALLQGKRSDAYERLEKIKGATGTVAKFIRPYVEAKLHEGLDYDQKRVLTSNIFVDRVDGKVVPRSSPTSAKFKKFQTARELLQHRYTHPTVRIISGLSERVTASVTHADKIIDLLAAAVKIFPVEEKF
jgi:hypothetical protein